jgi:hypothetical protein
MIANQTLGRTEPESGEKCEYLALSFSPLSAPLCSRWRNNGLSADFLGDYVTTFFSANGDVTDTPAHQKEIKHAVTYIANEFLENAMKYHERDVDIPIGIRLELTGSQITISASNGVGAEQSDRYKAFVERVLSQDAGELLLCQLEESAAGKASIESGLGLLTMINDYGARLGWQFEGHPRYPGFQVVTTSAVLFPAQYKDANGAGVAD